MYSSFQNSGNDKLGWFGGAVDAIDLALEKLEQTRAATREQLYRFSQETMRRWMEIEHEIEVKLDDIRGRVAESGETARDAAIARLGELTSSLQELMQRHLHCPARTLMSASLHTCSPGDSLERAAGILWEGDCGALPVVNEAGRLVGMITDRDICMAVYTQGRPPSGCAVSDSMSRRIRVCAPDDSIEHLAQLMSAHQVRRLPVVDSEGRLLGIVSLADVARHLNGLASGHPARELLVPTLAAISMRPPVDPEVLPPDAGEPYSARSH
jgi:CBS domain-containing protein